MVEYLPPLHRALNSISQYHKTKQKQIYKGWRNSSVNKVFALQAEGLQFSPQVPLKKERKKISWVKQCVLIVPATGSQRQGDSWDLQARQLSLLDNLCANEKPCLYLFICSFLKGFICASGSFAYT